MSLFVVGLTGGIGSGKSTVAQAFLERGVALVDTDAISHELTASGGAAMPEIVAAFGPAVAGPDGALDRAAMRRLVFAEPAARQRLEGILHPRIRALSDERCRSATTPYVLLAVPLLVESGSYRERCDRILVVDCPEDLQIARVMRRSGLSAEEAQAILATQATRAARLAVADDVLHNDGMTEAIIPQVKKLHDDYLRMATAKLQANC